MRIPSAAKSPTSLQPRVIQLNLAVEFPIYPEGFDQGYSWTTQLLDHPLSIQSPKIQPADLGGRIIYRSRKQNLGKADYDE
jgi:hypothetical protein